MNLFLTPEEMFELTGYKRSLQQIKWLDNHGWIFTQNANNRPIVTRKYAEAKLGIEAQKQPSNEPNFDAIRRL